MKLHALGLAILMWREGSEITSKAIFTCFGIDDSTYIHYTTNPYTWRYTSGHLMPNSVVIVTGLGIRHLLG